MDILEAIVLGIIQGLTEFLPVSSSGHLELAKSLFGENIHGKESMTMTVVLHFATALSTIFVFRKDISELFKGIFSFKWNKETQFASMILISMIPAVIVGIKFDSFIENLFSGKILLVGSMLMITGVLLFLADRSKNTEKDVSWSKALIIGIAQAIAILPGISRSGATIGTSVLLGVDKEKAARFSFLMVVPLIFGKMAKDSLEMINATQPIEFNYLYLLTGFIAAFIVGFLACKWMIKLVKKSKLVYFAYYCFAIGLLAIIFSL